MKRLNGLDLLQSLFTHRRLAWETAKHDLKTAYIGSFLGIVWAIVGPLVQVVIYLFVISFIFRVRSPAYPSHLDYALHILAGLVPWLLFSYVLREAPGLVRDRMALVKQVVYPIETLPISRLICHSTILLMGFGVYFILKVATGAVPWTIIFLPAPVALGAIFLIGMGWLFMIAGVIFKDLREITGIILGFLIFVSPVLISRDMVSTQIWTLIMYNPLSHFIVCFRDVLEATWHPWSWLIATALGLFAVTVGGWLLGRTKLLINEYL